MDDLKTKLIHKIADAVEILYDPYGLREAQKNYTKLLLEKIVNDDNLSIEEQMAAIQEYEFLLKKNKNRHKIISEAQSFLSEEAQPEKVDDSWIVNFWDKAGTVTDSVFQEMWSRILAEEVNHPSTISKRLLLNLSLMSSEDANKFLNLSRFCFLDKFVDMAHPIIYIKEFSGDYAKSKITTDMLKELEQFDLIETNYETGFSFKKKKVLTYQDYVIELYARRIPVGNVKLTADGQKLFKIIKKQNNNQILDYTIEKLQYKKCNVNITHWRRK